MAIEVIFFDLGNTLVKTSPASWLPGARDLLKSLKHNGTRLGIISNTAGLNSLQEVLNILPANFDISLFESGLILFSSLVGIEKPDPAIFAKAVQVANVDADKCVYCSEDIIETLVAQRLGLFSVRVRPPPGGDLVSFESFIVKFETL